MLLEDSVLREEWCDCFDVDSIVRPGIGYVSPKVSLAD